MTRHKEDHDKAQERESLYVTIQGAAQICGVGDKTIQRAILQETCLPSIRNQTVVKLPSVI